MTSGRTAGEPRPAILGVILAGGRSTRMGGLAKGDVMLGGRPMIAHVIDRFRPQVGGLILNAPHDRYVDVTLTHVPDPVAGQPGPLAGLLAGMHWAEVHAPETEFVATAPVDTPFLPDDVVARLVAAFTPPAAIDIAYAASPAGPQPVFVVARIALAAALERDLKAGAASRVGDWIRRQRHAVAAFATDECFANVNSPDELAAAETRLRAFPH